MKLFGREWAKDEILKYIGNMSQIVDARESVLTSGKADGVRVIDVRTAGGLSFAVVPSRGMDIAWAEYKGVPISYIGKPSVGSPAYYEKDGAGFLRNFFAGLVTTCGLTYMGAPCNDNGEELGLHGRVNNIPAYDVGITRGWEGEEYMLRIKGTVAQSAVFGENMVLEREITVKMGAPCVNVFDHIENRGFESQPLMVLYHCNFGFPLVSEDAILLIPENTKVSARDVAAQGGIEQNAVFEKPTAGYQEQVFYLDTPKVHGNNSCCALYNQKLGLGAYIEFNREQFPRFVEWKMMGEGEYVVGLEPGNATPEGRVVTQERGELTMLKPGESKDFTFSIGVCEGKSELLQKVQNTAEK